MIIQADNLSVGYNKPLIENICFNINGGEIMTLIGPNASGKSTILKTIAGYLEKKGGMIYIGQKNIDDFSPKQRSEKLAVVLTDRIKPDMMTCREVVETGRYPYTGYFGIITEKDRAEVEKAINMVDIAEFADKDFSEISDGQRQRVMLARAICQEPKILILDEPTSYLDIHHKIFFLEILRNLASKYNIAVIVSMHELELAKIISDYAVCVNNGQIVCCGKPDDVFTHKIIRKVFDIPENLYEKYLSHYYF